MKNKSLLNAKEWKSVLTLSINFIELQVLEPFVNEDYVQYRVQGNDKKLCTMDNDGGQMVSISRANGQWSRSIKNRFKDMIHLFLSLTQCLRRKLFVRPHYS